jgi:hypothetical protein
MLLFNLKNILLFVFVSIILLLNQSCAESSETLTVEAGENQTVQSMSTVNLTGTVALNGVNVISSIWQQVSGPTIELAQPSSPYISFISPIVLYSETIVLSYTVSDNNNNSVSDEVSITVTPRRITIPNHVLLFTEQRIGQVKNKIARDDKAWKAMESKVSHYFERVPYNAGEYAGAFALAYYISGDPKYINRAIELLNIAYFDEPDIGWEYYKSRNQFRTNARWAIMGYSWIKSFISPLEQSRIENILKLWSDFWLLHVDFTNDFHALRIADTDDVTSITKNITLLGTVLSASNTHRAFGEQMLSVGDTLLDRYIVGYYMQDIMKGGTWAEGSDYSPATQGHWIETFIINKDQRGIEYPVDYAKFALQALLHQTLSSGTGVYKYGSEESAVDYDALADDYRYEFALNLMSILQDGNDLALINSWFNKIIAKQGFKSGSMVTHMDRLLYHDPTLITGISSTPAETFYYSEGVGFIASRDSWDDEATNFYFINRNIRVDHEHKDALSFDIAHNGVWITKEATGYSGMSETSAAHNTILIENAANGSSSPTRRPAGNTKYNSIYNDESVTLISADATKAYNMSGYFATDYALLVNRQVAFIKPNIVIAYDHIITDKAQIRDLKRYTDLDLSTEMEHTRWVKIIQHAQAEPSLIENSINSYQVESEQQLLSYQVLYPANATVKIIDQKELWQNSLEYEVPENQRKWHFEVSLPSAQEDNEFITALSFGASNETSINKLLLDSILMTQDNYSIISGNITGIAISTQHGNYIILFNKNPEQPVTNAKIMRPEGYVDAPIYTIGFQMPLSNE